MKKLLIILVITAFCLSGCGNNNENLQNTENDTNTNYSASKTSTSTTNNSSNMNNNTSNNNSNNNNDVVIINNEDNINTETDIASFSTKIYTPNDEARMNNLQITCSKLNGTIVKPR